MSEAEAKYIDVKAAGMFTPQEEGDCKLTIIIPKDDKGAQDFAFTQLRYQRVRIMLTPVEAVKTPSPAPTGDTGLFPSQSQFGPQVGAEKPIEDVLAAATMLAQIRNNSRRMVALAAENIRLMDELALKADGYPTTAPDTCPECMGTGLGDADGNCGSCLGGGEVPEPKPVEWPCDGCGNHLEGSILGDCIIYPAPCTPSGGFEGYIARQSAEDALIDETAEECPPGCESGDNETNCLSDVKKFDRSCWTGAEEAK